MSFEETITIFIATLSFFVSAFAVSISSKSAQKSRNNDALNCGVSKNLIYDLFFDRYKSIYCQLLAHTMLLPDVDYCGKDLITETVRKVYAEVSSWSV